MVPTDVRRVVPILMVHHMERIRFVRGNAASGSIARNTTSPERKTNEASAADEWDFALQVKVKIECIINELLKTCKLLKISKIR